MNVTTHLSAVGLLAALSTAGCASHESQITSLIDGDTRRTPAEWEEQAGVWMQWPQAEWREGGMEASFVAITEAVAEYERVHLIADSERTQQSGEEALAGVSGDITWHIIDSDSSWMRDNGPRYVEVDGQLVLQNWAFRSYEANTPASYYRDDDALPDAVAEILDLPLEQVGLIHERGDLEVNGSDTAMVSWSVLSHRNPELSRDEITAQIQAALGVTSVIYVEGFHPLDITRGHTDGLARFIAEDTVVVGQDGSQLFEDVAEQIAEQRPDLTILRMSMSDYDPYLNWLVGDGFVLTGMGSNDAAAREQLQQYFPDREIRFVDVDALWENGGGVHCVTNDQPLGAQ